jgi:GNAT superfamily N-acetyltransferase
MSVSVRIASAADINRIRAAYDAWNYRAGIAADDTLWIAEQTDVLVGVVRIVPENDTLVLRGMRVAEEWRGVGIGGRMLQAIATWLAKRQCYCIPYVSLLRFYGQAGFGEIAPTAAPPFLAERLGQYRLRALDVTIMVRPDVP